MSSRGSFFNRLLLIPLITFLLTGCVTYKDKLETFELNRNVLSGWFTVDSNDPEWSDSNVGFGINNYLAEAWYDIVGLPLQSPVEEQKKEILTFQNLENSYSPEEFKSYQGPIIYGEVVWAGVVRQKSNVSIISRTSDKYIVEVKITLLDIESGQFVYAYGSGEAARKAGALLFELKKDSMEFEETAGYIALRNSIKDALFKINRIIKVQGNL